MFDSCCKGLSEAPSYLMRSVDLPRTEKALEKMFPPFLIIGAWNFIQDICDPRQPFIKLGTYLMKRLKFYINSLVSGYKSNNSN